MVTWCWVPCVDTTPYIDTLFVFMGLYEILVCYITTISTKWYQSTCSRYNIVEIVMSVSLLQSWKCTDIRFGNKCFDYFCFSHMSICLKTIPYTVHAVLFLQYVYCIYYMVISAFSLFVFWFRHNKFGCSPQQQLLVMLV